MNAKEIVEKYLVDNKFDGLTSDECCCDLDDLIPCDKLGFDISECEPGYKIPCNPKACKIGGGCDYHIAVDKKIE